MISYQSGPPVQSIPRVSGHSNQQVASVQSTDIHKLLHLFLLHPGLEFALLLSIETVGSVLEEILCAWIGTQCDSMYPHTMYPFPLYFPQALWCCMVKAVGFFYYPMFMRKLLEKLSRLFLNYSKRYDGNG